MNVKVGSNYDVGACVLKITDCCRCGVVFGVPERILTNRREKGGDFYCPNGHALVFTETEVKRLRREAKQARAREVSLRDQKQATERALAAQKGQVTKLKKRAAGGACPCCNRSFVNVARHMASQHPDFAVPEAER